MDVKLLSTGDWEVLYVNNKLYAQGHSISPISWFELGQMYPKFNYSDIDFSIECDMEIMDEIEYLEFDEDFNDIPEEVFI